MTTIEYVLQKRHPNVSPEWVNFKDWHDHPDYKNTIESALVKKRDQLNSQNLGVEYRIIQRVERVVHAPNATNQAEA